MPAGILLVASRCSAGVPRCLGSSKDDILNGKIQPVAWSPGSDPWVAEINQTWRDRTGQLLIRDACPATIHVPLAIAMWRPWPRHSAGRQAYRLG